MRVLLLTSSLDCGGAESHVASLARALKNLGHSVTVASSGGRMADGLEGSGVRHLTVCLNKRDPFSIARAKKRLKKIIKSGEFDVLHAHARLPAYIADGIARQCGLPFVVTVHAKFSAAWIYRSLSRWGDTTIAVSEDLRHYVCKNYGISPENTEVIPNGIDTKEFFYIPRLTDGLLRIVFASRLDYDCSEGAFLLLELADRIKSKFPTAEIYFCGGGEAYTELSRLSAGRSFVHTLGNVGNMGEVLRKADLFIGVSRAAMEAMSCGAVTILGGNEGYFGILKSREELQAAALKNFCCRDEGSMSAEKLYNDICRCLSMSLEERNSLGKLLSDYIAENNGAEAMARRTAEVYSRALEESAEKKGRVTLCGYYGYGNMGDNALLRNALSIARARFPHKKICVLTKAPRRDRREFKVECIRRRSPIAVFRELRRTELLVFGGGTLLQDYTSLRSLLYYVALIRLAALFGVSVELWGNGLGQPQRSLGRRLMRSALSACRYVGLRDTASLCEAWRLVENEQRDKLFYEKDLALGQAPSATSRIAFLMDLFKLDKKNAPNGYAVAAVRGGAGRGYKKIFAEWLATLKADGIRILFVPMYPREDSEDSVRLCRELGGEIAYGISEGDMVGLIRESTVVCSMRLHALVFAAGSDTPFVGFGADPKIESFCRENGGLYFTELY